ncbi:MAG: two-component system C4-dicarboxylate transport sensor histidine kinase DctB [Ascidiaceihabitans sp.]|jgi:two-component system C4-dicarboxylate transport sensor histidine kinase DctB
MRREFLYRVTLIVAFLVLVLAVATGVWRYGYGQALNQLSRQAEADLALASDRLTGQLQRYRELAVLTADRPALASGITNGTDAAMRALLLEIADKTAALDIMLVDGQGLVLSSARGPVGIDLSHTAYVQRAMQGALGSTHGVRSPENERVFYYAAPVFGVSSQVLGVVVVAVNIAAIEWDWVGGNPAVLFTDKTGEVFISNRSELVFWRRPLGQAGLAPPTGDAPLFDSYLQGRHEVWQLGWGPYLPQNALHLTRDLPVVGMIGEVLMDVRPARRLAMLQAAAVAALFLAFGAFLFVATERRRTLAQANAQLEARVAERTVELEQSNTQLRREAFEREEAQTALAQAQADLVQASKLSALGQMSAGISHELNQPLMAIRSFAENGLQFMERDKPEKATENLVRISDLARRMGRIIKNLRAFARQETESLVKTDVIAVLDSALELTRSRLHQDGVVVRFERPNAPIYVRGGEVRLGQVFVNLITNAADAMRVVDDKTLHIRIDHGETLLMRFLDTGPGIDVPEKMFDPFYSTKEVGASEGMGLGLSISYGIIQGFGGEIRGGNGVDGAEFTVQLNYWHEEDVG